MTRDRALRGISIALVLALGVAGIAMSSSILAGGGAWLLTLAFVFSGWGWLVVRASRAEDVDFGLRAMWGAAAYVGIAGMLVAIGVCNRPIMLVALATGFAAFAWREWVTPAPLWMSVRDGVRAARERPLLAYLVIIIASAALIHVVGAIVHLDRNPWDDDVAYTPLQQRLLEAGNLIEPFSFRRLAAYGGQTALQALVGARGQLASIHAFDRGLCYALVLLLLVGHARVRRTPGFWLALIAVVVVLTPEIAINTASYWSGIAFFYALYRTLAISETRRMLAVATLVGAATCTLRMNYIAVVVPLFLFAFALRGRGAWREQLTAWRLGIAVGVVAIVPWAIAAFISSKTFLFPFMAGTWNNGLSVQPSGWTWVDQLSLLLQSFIITEPIVVMPVLFLLFVIARDTRPGRPFTIYLVASTLGFLLLARSFTSADAYSLWRYALGYMFVLVIVFAIEVPDDDGPIKVAPLARWVLLAAMLVQFVFAHAGVVKRYTEIFHDVGEARHAAREATFEAIRYTKMQSAVPRGARLIAMVDDPVHLDFSRNDVMILDTPGFASPAPQMPSFVGPEALRAYFLDIGVRYVAFVRGDRSRYFYRRDFWVWRIFNDEEFFRIMSAYMVDTIDSLEQLAKSSTIAYELDGFVVIDLGTNGGALPELDPREEEVRRDAYVHSLAAREKLMGEWALTSRHDLIFADGMTGITYPQWLGDPHWYDVVYDREPLRGTPLRWLQRRAHFRVRGTRDMHLVLRGAINLNSIYTRPRVDVSIDGEPLASANVDANGAFTIDAIVHADQLDGWTDLYMIFNSVGQPEADINDIKVARLEDVTWEPH